MDSYRTHLGARLHHSFSDFFAIYAGAAWEQEWDAWADGTLNGYEYPAPHAEGKSGLADFGLSVNFTEHITLDLKGVGTWGRRTGIGGVCQFTVAW